MSFPFADYIPRRHGRLGMLGALLTAGSRVLFQGDTEAGLIGGTSQVLNDFTRFMQQRGLTVENVTYTDLGIDWSGARMIRVYAQVVTPIDRADSSDLLGDLTQDLQRSGSTGGPVNNPALSIMVLAGKDAQGNPTYAGGALSLPVATGTPGNGGGPPPGTSIFDDLATALGVDKSTAELAVFGGVALLLVFAVKR